MIVLTKEQRDLFLSLKLRVIVDLLASGVDYVPIEAKGDLWILPDVILADARFAKMKLELDKTGEFDKYEQREMDESELKQIEINGRTKL